MLDVSAWAALKEESDKDFISLLEIDYSGDHADGDHSNCLYARFARYDKPVTWEGEVWTPFPIAPIESRQETGGEIPAFEISVSGVGRELASVFEQYDGMALRPGRVIKVHPDTLDDPTAYEEEEFTVLYGRVTGSTATITVSPVDFNALGIKLPRKKVASADFPGVLGSASTRLS